jgi:hypothetical protein
MKIEDLWNWEVGTRKSEILNHIHMFHLFPYAGIRMPYAL